MKRLLMHFDGACEPHNPGGVATAGWILIADDGEELQSHADVICEGPKATNNVAEYAALGRGLRWLTDNLSTVNGVTAVDIRGDSQLVVNQVCGEWKCNKPHLQKLRDRCRDLLATIEAAGIGCTLEWVPREENELADELSRQAYEKHTGRKFPMRRR